MTDRVLWIVPMRRVVVRTEISYRDLMGLWHDSLDVEKLAEWYWPLMDGSLPTYGTPGPAPTTVLRTTIRPALVSTLRLQKTILHDEELPRFMASEPAPAPRSGTAQPGPNRFREAGSLLVRLWKGPLRSLIDLELIAAGRADFDDDVRYDAQRRVTRRDATFLPGDVVEFPIFTVLQRAGVAAMAGVEFNPNGSFLTGTSVWKRVGDQQPPAANSPRGVVRLHDNLMAMHFQSLLNAALCGWYANGPAFKAGSRLDASCFRASVTGQGRTMDIRARGLVYMGTLADPMSGPDPLFTITNFNHGDGKAVGNSPLVLSFPDSGRFTWGWSCNPAQLLLAYYMAARTDNWNPGGTPMRHATTMRSRTQPMVYFTRTRWAARISLYYASMRESSEDQTARRREEQLEQRRAEEEGYVSEPTRELAFHERHERVLHQATSDDSIEITPTTTDGELRTLYERAQRTVLTELAGGANWLPPTMGEQRQTFAASSHPRTERFEFAEAEANFVINRETLLQTFCSTLNPIVLDGHCFTYVRVWPHAKLLDERTITQPSPRPEDADPSDASLIDGASPTVGPPTTSLIAAYNPLTGEPYTTAPEGDLYNFEASGAMSMIKAAGRGGPNVIFGAKTFVWRKMHGLRLHATTQARGGWIVELAEQYDPPAAGDPPLPGPLAPQRADELDPAFRARRRAHRIALRAWERSQPDVRTKPLVSVSFFDEARLRLKYAIPRVYEPIAFSRTNAALAEGTPATPAPAARRRARPAQPPATPREDRNFHRENALTMHARRAVPFETRSEAEGFEQISRRYQTVSHMREKRTRAENALERWLATLPPNPPAPPVAEGETAPRRPKTERDLVQAAIDLIRGTRSTGGG